jgi:hypothetical protein
MAKKFDWTCDECAGSEVAKWVVLTGPQYRKALDYDLNHPHTEEAKPMTAADLRSLSDDRGIWTTMCAKHADVFPDDGYFFETDRINTHAAALDWTLHLLEKGWLQYTDWDGFLRSKLVKSLDA